MRRPVQIGTKQAVGPSGAPRLPGFTFVELIVTIFLLTAFSSLAFTLFWTSTKADMAHNALTAAQQARQAMAIYLHRLTEEIRIPYWANPDKVFQDQGSEWKVFYLNGDPDDFLILRLHESGLDLVSKDSSLSINNLPNLSLDWWKKDGRIIGVLVHWLQGTETVAFHAAWGAQVL